MSTGNFVIITVKKKLKAYENGEHIHTPKSVWVHVQKMRWGSLERKLMEWGPSSFSWVFLCGKSPLLADWTLQQKLVILLWQSYIN